MQKAIEIINEELNKVRPQDYENMIICQTLNDLKKKLESVPAEMPVMPKPTHWLKLKLIEMLVELESRVDRHYNGSWIVNDKALQEHKDGVSYIKQLLSV